MRIEVLESKMHRVKITPAELHYVGSITIDEALMEAADIEIIITYASMDKTDTSGHSPLLVFHNDNNLLTA